MTLIGRLVGCVSVALIAGVAMAQTGVVPGGVTKDGFNAIDVRGYTLGSTPEEFRQQLAKGGFQAENTSRNQVDNGLYVGALRSTIENYAETDHVRSMVAWRCDGGRCPQRLNYSAISRNESVGAVFLGPGNENRAWAVGVSLSYKPEDAPSKANTLAALTEKYGSPSSGAGFTFYWYWDANGRLLPRGAYNECNDAMNDARSRMTMPTNGTAVMTNLATSRTPALRGLDRAQCVSGVTASMGSGTSRDTAETIGVVAVALKAANVGSVATYNVGQGLANAAAQKALDAANTRKPTF